MAADSIVSGSVHLRAVGRLQLCAGKFARTVLRGGRAGNGTSLPGGKARNPFEFGVKVSLVITHKQGLMIGARSFPGDPYDGHVLSAQLEQTANLRRLLKRRQAIESLIGHTKTDHRMDRSWLQGAVGHALHALCCAAGYNILWLLRAIVRLGLKGLF